MKAFLALAFLAVCAAELEPVELPEPAVPYVEPVKVVDVPDLEFNPDDSLRIVNFVEVPEPVFDVDAIANNFMNDDGFQELAPSELESIQLIDVPQDENNVPYPYRPRIDPMWR